MRVIVIGATGNVGTSVTAALAKAGEVEEIVAVARRAPGHAMPKTTFAAADITRDDLIPILRGADAVVHLAWLIQPGRDERVTAAVNVDGSERVFRAAVQAGVPAIVYASSVGAYSPGPKDRRVDERWPTDGIPTSFYSRHKAAVERSLDRVEHEHPNLRVVRLRPGLIFKAQAATEIRRLFLGPLLPTPLIRPRFIPVVPDTPRLRFQAVHSDDVGEAYALAVLSDARGAFNVATEPVLDSAELGRILGARPIKVPASVLRGAAAATYAARLQPAEPGWVDMALSVPLMDCGRARSELDWRPIHDAAATLRELLAGLKASADHDTPPLAKRTSGPARVREFLTGVGRRP
ncbi:MAG: UDP-glucose 4-epimerase [Solirubrobacteraceae bacterium]|jgi:nucleoside-diphosphate-sugar epimerase|nr:UDP-glucose 4-epimerase [Solirubrobacteraceae bacterium]